MESPPRLHLVRPGEGSPSRSGEKKTLERPQRSAQFPQGHRWELATKKDCLRGKSHLPSCLRPPTEPHPASGHGPQLYPVSRVQKEPQSSLVSFTPPSPASPNHQLQAGPPSGVHGHSIQPRSPNQGQRSLSGKKGFCFGVWLSPRPLRAPSSPAPCRQPIPIIPPS